MDSQSYTPTYTPAPHHTRKYVRIHLYKKKKKSYFFQKYVSMSMEDVHVDIILSVVLVLVAFYWQRVCLLVKYRQLSMQI